MKRIILLTVFSLLYISTLFAQKEHEEELIKKAIQTAYVDGLCNNANEEQVKMGIHDGFELLYAGKGNTLWKLPIHNWTEMAKEGKAKGHKYSFQNELTTIKFLFIDIEGSVAVAKIEFYEGKSLNYIDYLSLIKFDNGWKIVSKIAHPIPQTNNK